MASKSKYCPPWIIKVISSLMVYDYIVKDESLLDLLVLAFAIKESGELVP